jgi:hypothetical protein
MRKWMNLLNEFAPLMGGNDDDGDGYEMVEVEDIRWYHFLNGNEIISDDLPVKVTIPVEGANREDEDWGSFMSISGVLAELYGKKHFAIPRSFVYRIV